MTVKEGIDLFRAYQKNRTGKKTLDGYGHLLRHLEMLLAETPLSTVPLRI